MLTYQIYPRHFIFANNKTPAFPSEGLIHFYLRPLQPFGMENGGGRTAVVDGGNSLLINQNTGVFYIKSQKPLAPLDVKIEEEGRTIELNGNVLTIRQVFQDLDETAAIIDSLYYGLPMCLNVELADPPYVERVDGEIGGCTFRWELSEFKRTIPTGTTQELQSSAVKNSWRNLSKVALPGRRRILGSIHYFHVACRLARQGNTPGEFLAEVLLNLAKVLEALFPAPEEGMSIEAARAGLRRLKYSDNQIEGYFVPAIALRNQVDVGHVQLALLTTEQLAVIQEYAERAESKIKQLIIRVLERIEADEAGFATYEDDVAGKSVEKIVKRIQLNLPRADSEL